MITVITKFILPSPVSHDEARAIFLNTAPNYQGIKGLFRKTYFYSEDGTTVGGIYLWNSKEEAQAVYTKEWFAFVHEKYGTEVTITYLESPVVVDNITNEILVDE